MRTTRTTKETETPGTARPRSERCPKCGQPFDPQTDAVVECPRCGVEGSTACCNPGGRNCICAKCEEGGDGG